MKKQDIHKMIKEEIVKEIGEPYYAKPHPIQSGDLYKWLSGKPSEMPIEVWVGKKYVDFTLDNVYIDNTRNKIVINLD